MPRRILTQKQMQVARREVDFCYLCGRALPARRKAPLVRAEHVVAAQTLTEQPGGDFPVVLDVHEECDAKHKNAYDQFNIVLQRAVLNPAGPLRDQDQGLLRPVVAPRFQASETGEDVPLLDAGAWFRVAKNWVKGFHAALYKVPLATPIVVEPPVRSGFMPSSRSPVRVMSLKRLHHDLLDADLRAEQIREIMRQAVARDEWDGITAWSGGLNYRCTWMPVEIRTDRYRFPWQCCWAVEVPRMWEVCKAMGGPPRPWRGFYGALQPPMGASVLASVE